jgi:copper chaperone CopZ
MEQVVVVVPDMTCNHCVMRVSKAISGQPGTAKYDPTQATLEAIAASIADAGYTAQQP